MMNLLLKHEILNLLKTGRVYLTIITFLLLFMTVFTVRVMDYQKTLNQYIADVRINDEQLQAAENFSFLNPRAIQQPIIFSIYHEGFNFSRVVDIIFYNPIIQTTSLHTEINILDRENSKLDITFLITFFLSLFILLITYDSVNGEKQNGTLRLFMTYPLKRQNFIIKKVLGVFVLVIFTFTIPYLLSMICLIVKYSTLLSVSFFHSIFFYWFVVMLFVFSFSLLGVLISCFTSNPNRSLVYSLLIWFLLIIILPISWDYIVSPRVYKNRLDNLQINYQVKLREFNQAMNNPPEGSNPREGDWAYLDGYFYNTTVLSLFSNGYEGRLNFQKYVYDFVFPISKEVEMSMDELLRVRINKDKIRTRAFFYNPVVLLNDLATKITGNSREDHLRFLQDSRGLRNEIINQGIYEGWLWDNRFFARFDRDIDDTIVNDFFAGNLDFDGFYSALMNFLEHTPRFEMEVPNLSRYEQPNQTFSEIFQYIVPNLAFFMLIIIVLWVVTWQVFLKYDVR